MYRFAIIGAGVIGGMIARELTKYEKNIVILEKEEDVAMGQSKANSGIVHAGYDPQPGTLKAELNVRGNLMMEQVCRELDVKFRHNGTLVAGFDQEDEKTLNDLLERGKINGVPDLEIISGEKAREMEKNLSDRVKCALYAPTGAIVCPYELTIHSIGNAMDNGAELIRKFEVSNIEKKECFKVYSSDGRNVEAEYIINAAGIHSDEVAKMAGDDSFLIKPRKGEYLLLDKEAGDLTGMTVFRVPSKMGKGVLATSTVDGNILLGPTSEDVDDKEDKSVTREGLDSIISKEYEFYESIPLDKVITQFTGVRAHGSTGDFIINNPADGFFNVAGIESPGLTSAPAIAEKVIELIRESGIVLSERKDFDPLYEGIHFKELSIKEKNEIIEKDPSFGRIICRCEEVTEGEIIQAIRKNPGATDVDGVKRRTRAGMGRCQGGFCMPQVAEIIARELGIKYSDVTKNGGDSKYIVDEAKLNEHPEKTLSCADDLTDLYDVTVIGGGPAGMAAACSAKEAGAEKVIIVEREPQLGGILEQCIHNGFGLHKFRRELTGPEYGEIYEKMVYDREIANMVNTMVINIEKDSEYSRVLCVNKKHGYFEIKTKAVVLAMGCREKPRGALSIPGTRPAGVYSAGTAQKLVNIKGYMPGKKIVILGSGDIGLIMARRMTLEGAEVKAVCEILPDSGGLTRNIVQCLNDFNIPLKLNTTVIKIHGNERVTGVTIAGVDEFLRPVSGTEEFIECDTLLLSVGLIPENELSKKAGIVIDPKTRGPVVNSDRETSVEGIFACGNVVKVHELVDYVSEEGEIAGRAAAEYATGKRANIIEKKLNHRSQPKGVKNISSEEDTVICTLCPNGCKVKVIGDETSGNSCSRGREYALQEIKLPVRTLTSTAVGEGNVLIPVKTDKPVPRERMFEIMEEINRLVIALPVKMGDIVIENVLGLGMNVVADRSFVKE